MPFGEEVGGSNPGQGGEGGGGGGGGGGFGQPSGGGPAKEPGEGLFQNPTHKSLDERPGGDWQCGSCGNVNLASRGQVFKCNMNRCKVERFMGDIGGAEEAALAVTGKNVGKAWESAPREKKRVSLYANQGGGLANPSNKKKKREGDASRQGKHHSFD
jgi:hypothetical protein